MSLRGIAISLAASLVLIGIAFYAGASWDKHRNLGTVKGQEVVAQHQVVAAEQSAAAGNIAEKQGAAHGAAAQTAEARVATHKRELAALQARLPQYPQLPPPSTPEPGRTLAPTLPPSSAAPEAALIIAKQAEVIADLDQQVWALKLQVSDLSTADIAHKAEALHWEQAYRAQAVASEAYHRATASWRGGIAYAPAQGGQPPEWGAWAARDTGRFTVEATAFLDRVSVGVGVQFGAR